VKSSNFVINIGFGRVRLPSEFLAYLCLFGFSVFPFFVYSYGEIKIVNTSVNVRMF